MIGPTDAQIFGHMSPAEDYCSKCGGDDVEPVVYEDYTSYICLVCDFEPTPPEEE
jgi:hypothetical protein